MSKKISMFVADDETNFLKLVQYALADKFDIELFERGKAALTASENKEFDVGILDIHMPDINGVDLLKLLKSQNSLTEYIILSGQADISSAIESMKIGCYDFLTKPISMDELEAVIQKAYEKKLINKENIALKEELQLKDKYFEMVGKSRAMNDVFSLIEKVAKTQSLVLITGESGTGKELAAKAIHKNSLRADKPFIVVDCTSLPENLLENELFGHEKGAFTDAFNLKRGLFEVADGGTLFIDEIGEMDISIQSKLLRVIETQTFRRLGGNKEISVDVRLIAATNKNLIKEVESGSFRKDLYYRLNVFPILMPPLRERKDDIPLLIKHFLSTTDKTTATKSADKDTTDILTKYNWPGNVRELANIIERINIICTNDIIKPSDLPFEFVSNRQNVPTDNKVLFEDDTPGKSLSELVADYERKVILKTIDNLNGDKTLAAKNLGLSRAQLYRKLKQDNSSAETEAIA